MLAAPHPVIYNGRVKGGAEPAARREAGGAVLRRRPSALRGTLL